MSAGPDEPPETDSQSLWREFVAAEMRGEKVDFDRLCAARPDQAAELRELQRAHLLLERGLESFSVSDPSAELQRATFDALLNQLRQRGRVASRYRLGRELGRGGMGIVFEAFDEDLRRPVAFKVIRGDFLSAHHLDARKLARFLEEAQVTGQLEHPGIVPVHELGIDENGRVYFTMQLVEGETLKGAFQHVRSATNGWTRERALGVLLRICEAVAFAHARGVLHRDLKPDNVMLGSFGQVYVMDWGLARLLEGIAASERPAARLAPVETARRSTSKTAESPELHTQHGQQLGTPAYMSPEQASGRIGILDARSDVYALGSILYELLAGHPPFCTDGSSSRPDEILRRVLLGPPDPIARIASHCPEELAAICERAMARDAALRYPTAQALGDDLRAYIEGRVVRAHRTGPLVELRKWIGRNRATAASVAAALVAVVAGAGGIVWLKSRNEVLAIETRLIAERKDKEYADSLAATQRRQLAESHFTSARFASQRGGWRESLASVERARVAGYEDVVELDILEAEALIATGRSAAARPKLASVLLDRATSRQRGRIQLALAGIAQSNMKSVEPALEHVRAALREELSDADRAYARGMVADRTVDALASFDEALQADSFHLGALNARLFTLFFLGRYSDAVQQATVQRVLFPEDPSAQLLLAAVEEATGDSKVADALFDELETSLGAAVNQLVREPAATVAAINHLPVTALTAGFQQEGVALEARLLPFREVMLARRSDHPGEERSIRIPTVASVAAAYEVLVSVLTPVGTPRLELLETLLSGDKSLLNDPESCVAELDRATQHHDDGLFHLLRGLALLTSPLESEESQGDKLHRCLPSFERAMKTSSMVPRVACMARYLASRCYNDLIAYCNDDSLRPRAIDAIQSMRVDVLTDWAEVHLLGSLGMTCHKGTESLRIVDDWIEMHPDDFVARAARINILRVLGAPGTALAEADALVESHPDQPVLREARDKAARAVEDARVSSPR